MAIFMGSVTNRVDAKGRVSVPASFRAALAGQAFQGIVLWPSYRNEALDCCAMTFMDELMQRVDRFDLFSDAQDDITQVIFASANQLAFDPNGRILLSDELRDHAGIGETAVFVGRGRTFQIWDPGKFEKHRVETLDRAKRTGLTLPLRPRSGGDA